MRRSSVQIRSPAPQPLFSAVREASDLSTNLIGAPLGHVRHGQDSREFSSVSAMRLTLPRAHTDLAAREETVGFALPRGARLFAVGEITSRKATSKFWTCAAAMSRARGASPWTTASSNCN
jgi:hypothetical protein